MEVYLIGNGGNSKIVKEICQLNNYYIVDIFDDGIPNKHIVDIKNYGHINIINTIGDIKTRLAIFELLKNVDLNWINCIHPKAYISPSVKIGKGNIVCIGSIINPDTHIGDFNIINTNTVIEHDCIIGDNNHIAPGSICCGNVNILNNNFIGAKTIIKNRINIKNNNIIGCGSVVVRDINSYTTSFGNPAHHNTSHF